jgi:basic membrane lipoprotein Med (substrate-binding protein (PBP1-ABC) superfamily)
MNGRRFTTALLVLAAAAVAATTAGVAGGAEQRLKVRVVTVTPITAGTWDPSHYKSYSAVAKRMNWNMQIAQALPYGKADQVFDRWGAEGVDIVFSTDNGFQSHMLAAAKKYPKTLWVTMSDLSTTRGLKNVGAYSVDWCQAGFAQGVVAGLLSKTHKIGAVGAIPILPAQRTIKGLKYGANLVAKGTKVDVKYSGDFIDAQKGQEAANALMGGGDDVIVAVTQGGISPQIAAAVQSAGKLYVGSYADETKFAPKATVTSAIFDFSLGYQRVAQAKLAGTFKPGIYHYGIKEGFIKLAKPFRLGHSSIQKKVDSYLARLAAGKIKIPGC